MQSNRVTSNPGQPFDPDPFSIGALVLAAIATAANVYSAYNSFSSSQADDGRREDQRQARLHRWEADLHDLRTILVELQEFLASVPGVPDSIQPIKPLSSSLFLDEREFRRYRKILGQLIGKTKDLNNSSLAVIEVLNSRRMQGFLSDNVSSVRGQLESIRSFDSLDRSFASAFEALDLLIRTANYMRDNLIP
ncbi:MAG TPA: hypothetical protein VFE46_14220 [Pirellulales bacterium]|jgi:hypothetical protein|nr:hypothetical protein [Pirellulales bacterium]